jgi:hypothetical protein
MSYIKYLVGTPEDGPYANFQSTSDKAARAYVEITHGEILDEMEWTDDNGKPITLFIVPGESETDRRNREAGYIILY